MGIVGIPTRPTQTISGCNSGHRRSDSIESALYAVRVAASARTRYAKSGDVDIAYQVLGDGPIDLLLYTGAIIPIECMDEEPSMARFQRRLASFSRLIRFDQSGNGIVGPRIGIGAPTMEQWADDGVAVMDAVGSEQASGACSVRDARTRALMLAIAHPERVTGLVVMNGGARADVAHRTIRAASPRLRSIRRSAARLRTRCRRAGSRTFSRCSLRASPNDAAFRTWWDRAGNLGATPAMATAMNAWRRKMT